MKKTITQLKYITNELKEELVGDLSLSDACTIVLYTTMASILASVGIYAFAVYCI